MAEEKHSLRGSLMVLTAIVMFSLGGLGIKYVPLSALAINSMRCSIAVIIDIIFIKLTDKKLKVNRAVIVGALCVIGCNNLYVIANKLTTAGNAIVLQYTAPIFVIIFSMLIFKRKITKAEMISCALVFCGVLCFFIDSLSAGNMLGNFLAVLSGAFYGGLYMINASENANPITSLLIGQSCNVLIGLPFVLQSDFSLMGSTGWTWIIILGVFQLGLGYIFFTEGLKEISPVRGSLIGGVEPVLNPLLVAVFYGEKLSTLSLIGAAVVFITIFLYNVNEAKQK